LQDLGGLLTSAQHFHPVMKNFVKWIYKKGGHLTDIVFYV